MLIGYTQIAPVHKLIRTTIREWIWKRPVFFGHILSTTFQWSYFGLNFHLHLAGSCRLIGLFQLTPLEMRRHPCPVGSWRRRAQIQIWRDSKRNLKCGSPCESHRDAHRCSANILIFICYFYLLQGSLLGDHIVTGHCFRFVCKRCTWKNQKIKQSVFRVFKFWISTIENLNFTVQYAHRKLRINRL